MVEIIVKSLELFGIEGLEQIFLGILILLFFAYITPTLNRIKAEMRHKRKEFSNFWIAQRNIVRDSTLLLRTVMAEQELKTLFSDDILISQFIKAAKKNKCVKTMDYNPRQR